MKKVTIKDIAIVSGVSRGTVDRVINNRGNVKSEIRDRVLRVAKDLGYRKNMTASALATGKLHNLAIVIPDANTDPFWNLPLWGIQDALKYLKPHAFRESFYFFDFHEETDFRTKLEDAIASKPSCILLAPLYSESALEYCEFGRKANIPFITINTEIDHSNVLTYIGQSSFSSGFLAGKLFHAMVKGIKDVTIINFGHTYSNAKHYRDKVLGLKSYFEKTKLRSLRINSYQFDQYESDDEIRRFYERLRQENPNLSAIFFTNSRAYKLLNILDEGSKQRPFVVGFDLIEQNVKLMKAEKLDILINQNAMMQGYRAINSFVEHFILKRKIARNQYLPIDIVIKENVEFYLERRKLVSNQIREFQV